MKRTLVALVVPLAFLSACGDDGSAVQVYGSTPSGASSAPAPAVTKVAVTYGSVEELKDAAVAAGYSCAAWKQDDVVELAAQSGNCSDEDVFSIYASPGRLDSQLATSQGLDEMSAEYGLEPNPYLVGPNWIINGPGVEQLRAALGGTIVTN